MKKIKVDEVIRRLPLKDEKGYLCLARLKQNANVYAVGKNIKGNGLIIKETGDYKTFQKIYRYKRHEVAVFREKAAAAHDYFDKLARDICTDEKKKRGKPYSVPHAMRTLETMIYKRLAPHLDKTLEVIFNCEGKSCGGACENDKICTFCRSLGVLVKDMHADIVTEKEKYAKDKNRQRARETFHNKKGVKDAEIN
jgi:hypothetical protein